MIREETCSDAGEVCPVGMAMCTHVQSLPLVGKGWCPPLCEWFLGRIYGLSMRSLAYMGFIMVPHGEAGVVNGHEMGEILCRWS